MAKLDIKAFGLACGILWGGALLTMGITAMVAPAYMGDFVTVLGTKYIGYKATVPGIFIGGIWGFADAGIGGLILAWLYNKFSK